MKDKVCVITGGTDGIGKAAAYGLAVQGAKLLVHGRDPDKGARAVAELKARSGNPAIEFLQADFSSLADVRRLATAVMEHTPRVDVLVNTLKSAKQSRIVTTASNAHRGARILFDDLQATRKYSAMGAYGSSKLANILFTRTLAKRLQGNAVTATCLHPGFVRTNFGRDIDMSPVLKSIFGLIARFARSPEKGAETVVYLATSPQVQGASGGYYFDCKLTPPSSAAQDDSVAEHLWQVSEHLVGIA